MKSRGFGLKVSKVRVLAFVLGFLDNLVINHCEEQFPRHLAIICKESFSALDFAIALASAIARSSFS